MLFLLLYYAGNGDWLRSPLISFASRATPNFELALECHLLGEFAYGFIIFVIIEI